MCMCVLPPSSRAWCKMLHSLTLCSPLQLPPPQPLKSLRLTAPDAGPAFIEHCLLEEGFPPNARVNDGCDLSKGAQIAPKHAKLARDGERRREMEGDGETERDRGPPAYAHMHTHPYTRAHMHTHAPPPFPSYVNATTCCSDMPRLLQALQSAEHLLMTKLANGEVKVCRPCDVRMHVCACLSRFHSCNASFSFRDTLFYLLCVCVCVCVCVCLCLCVCVCVCVSVSVCT